ncbi:hypothetical protein [Phocaeicola coprophilus]|jgi:acetyltransferase-like isoleucine patch superfamily enzyme
MKKNKITWLKKCKKALVWIWNSFPLPQELGYCGKNTILLYPLRIYSPASVHIEENVKITHGLTIINSPTEKVIIKKYAVLAANCTIITNNHRKTVNIPQFLLGASHINDKSANVIIEEDAWIAAGVTIMAGVHIGRGSIIGTNSLVTKDVPPYAVVSGTPATIKKRVFSIPQIIEHEKSLYKKEERMTIEQLEELEKKYFQNMPIYGTSNGVEENLDKIQQIKSELHYIEPHFND